MSVATASSESRVSIERRVLLDNISWETYERLLVELDNRPFRLTYDHGALEIMTPSRRHEKLRRLIGRMIDQMTLELGIAIDGGGSTTYRKQLEERGLEPDECYYVANAERMRDREEVDLEQDPPPDLAVEVEITRSALDRMAIYASLGVPEVWRYDGKSLTVAILQNDGTYTESPDSLSFPFLPLSAIERFLGESKGKDETRFIREFRDWVRESLDVAPE
jgi:Uma2 family endonuclease